MGSPVDHVNWIEKNEIMDGLLQQVGSLTTHPMDHGFEAEVVKIGSDQESFVLKIWNKDSNPDIRFQFRLLSILYERGFPVSKPMGWGVNDKSESVLLTSFDGTSILKLNDKKIREIANILSSMHQLLSTEDIRNISLPKYDFIDYFFPGVRDHDDLHGAVIELVQICPIQQTCMIHGDFHLGNILEDNNQFSVIDWTNGQLGDFRYDFAWSLTLQKLYLSARYSNVFRSAYLMKNDISQEELEVFEALACLRWILLNRNGGVPRRPNTMGKVRGLISNNRFLKELELKEVQNKKTCKR